MVKIRAVGVELRTPDEAFAIHPVVEARTFSASPAEFSDPLIDIPATQGHEHSVSIFRAFGDDVYDSIDGVRAQIVPPGPRITSTRSMSSSRVSWTCQYTPAKRGE